MPASVLIVDTTLRDGEQAPGVAFTADEKCEVARLLAEVGVRELEVGIPAMGPSAVEAVRRIVELDLPCHLTTWARARASDVEAAAQSGAGYVHISFPVSDVQLSLVGKDEDWLLETLDVLVADARRLFDGVSVGALDATRVHEERLLAFARRAAGGGARRLRLADTVGVGRPATVHGLVTHLVTSVPGLPIEFHGHDDFGLATANSLAAVEAGAEAVSATVGGLGERAGNAPLEGVVAALHLLLGADTGIDLTRLPTLAARVAGYSGRPLSPWQPIVGDAIFTHESGVHVAGLLRDPCSFQPFQPEEVGAADSVFVAGKSTGSAALRHLLETEGIHVGDTHLDVLVQRVRHRSEDVKRSLDVGEVAALYSAIAAELERVAPEETRELRR